MKKIFKILLVTLVGLLAASAMFACSSGSNIIEVAPDVYDVTAGGDKISWGSAYGENPDLSNVMIDGYLDDELWTSNETKWYTHYEATPRIKYEMSSSISDKGLYVAFRSYDPFVSWTGYNYFFKNTNVAFHIYANEYGGNEVFLKLDANNLHPCNWYVNARSRYYGSLNQYGYGEGISAELFMAWDDMGVDMAENGVPESIKIMPVYNYRASPTASTTSKMLPTFVKQVGDLKQAIEFDKNGFMNYDDPSQFVGDHESGMAKTTGWTVYSNDRGMEVAGSNAKSLVGAPMAIFFKDAPASTLFKISTKIKLSEITSDSRFGLLMYRDAINYKAVAFATKKSSVMDGFSSYTLRGYTNYPANITNYSDLYNYSANKSGEVELLVYNNSGKLYYIVDGKYVASEEASYVSTNNYIGLYAFGVTAEFYRYDYLTFDDEEELLEDLSDYAYTINVYDDNKSVFSVETNHIAVPKEGGSVEVTMLFAEGYTASDVVLKRNATGEMESIMDIASTAVGGVFGLQVDDSISIYSTPKQIDETELVPIYLIAKDIDTNEDVYSISATLVGSGPFARFTCGHFSYGGMEMKVPKGYSWGYSAYSSEFPLIDGVLFDGAVHNERNDEPGIVYLKPYTLGGVARSELDENGKEVVSLTKSSTLGSVWDISQAESGLLTFQTSGSIGASQVYFSGRTISDYQVAYVEIVNRTDPTAFVSLENDPAAGFLIGGQNQSTFVGLRGTGVRILKDYPKYDNTRVEKNNIMSYQGKIGVIDRNNGGRFIEMVDGVGSVNRLPYDDKEFITSLLMIRKNGYVYLYACDGAANLTADKNAISKMKHVYTYHDEINDGHAAIGFGVTVAYNLRIDFQDFWLLTGEKAATFASDMIASDFAVNNAQLVNVSSDALISKTESDVSVFGKIANSSNLIFSPKSLSLGEKMIKITSENGQKYYLFDGQEEVYVPTENGSNVFNVEEVDGIKLVGSVEIPNDNTERIINGMILDSSGNRIAEVVTEPDGSFACVAEKNAGFNLVFSMDGYVMTPVEITDNGNVGKIVLEKSAIGGKVVRVDGKSDASTESVLYGKSVDEGLYFTYKSTAAVNGGVYVRPELMTENVIIDFTYERYAQPSSLSYGEDLDVSMGIVVYGINGSYGMRFIGDGYRIQLNDMFNMSTNIAASGVSPINLKGGRTVEAYDMRFIKLDGVVYMCAKPRSQQKYTVVYAMNVYDYLGSNVTDVKISWASSAGYLDLKVSNVKCYEVQESLEELTENMIASDLFVTGTDAISLKGAGLISYDEETGRGKFVKTSELIVEAKSHGEDEIIEVTVNGATSFIAYGEKLALKPSGSGDIIVSAVKTKSSIVTGTVEAPEGVNINAIYGLVIDANGREQSVVSISADGKFTAIVKEAEGLYLCFYTPNYVCSPIKIEKTEDVGVVRFKKSYVVTDIICQNGEAGKKTPSVRYCENKDGTIDVNYQTSSAVNGGVYIATENLKEDMVIYFSFERVKKPSSVTAKEDGDMSMGIVFEGATGKYGVRFIGRGYRIQPDDVYDPNTLIANSEAGSPVSMKENPTSEPFDFKFIKIGSKVYMCAKLRSQQDYVLVKDFDLMNSTYSVGSVLTDVKISWAANGWLDVRVSGIRLEDVTESNTTEIK